MRISSRPIHRPPPRSTCRASRTENGILLDDTRTRQSTAGRAASLSVCPARPSHNRSSTCWDETAPSSSSSRSGPLEILVLTLTLVVGVPALLILVELAVGRSANSLRRAVHLAIVAILMIAIALPIATSPVTASRCAHRRFQCGARPAWRGRVRAQGCGAPDRFVACGAERARTAELPAAQRRHEGPVSNGRSDRVRYGRGEHTRRRDRFRRAAAGLAARRASRDRLGTLPTLCQPCGKCLLVPECHVRVGYDDSRRPRHTQRRQTRFETVGDGTTTIPTTSFRGWVGPYHVESREPITAMCPTAVCSDPTDPTHAAKLAAMASDVAVLMGHTLMPPGLAARALPRIDQAWHSFGDQDDVSDSDVIAMRDKATRRETWRSPRIRNRSTWCISSCHMCHGAICQAASSTI